MWTSRRRQEGSENSGLESAEEGLRLGKVELGRRGVWVLAHLLVSRPPTPVTMVWHSACCAHAGVGLVLRGLPGASIAQFGTGANFVSLFHMDGLKGTGEVI